MVNKLCVHAQTSPLPSPPNTYMRAFTLVHIFLGHSHTHTHTPAPGIWVINVVTIEMGGRQSGWAGGVVCFALTQLLPLNGLHVRGTLPAIPPAPSTCCQPASLPSSSRGTGVLSVALTRGALYSPYLLAADRSLDLGKAFLLGC